MMKVPGHGASLSMMRVILTSPILNCFIAVLLYRAQLSPIFGGSTNIGSAFFACRLLSVWNRM
jgi:hypothetical protein